jgi:hypothetical protein
MWDDGVSNGGSEIIDYSISMAEQGGEFVVINTSMVSNYLVTGLTAGITYEFKV